MKNILLLTGLLLIVSCKSKKELEKPIKAPNVVFVLTDQWRAQDLGFVGNEQVITPAIDELAKEAVVFTNAISNLPVCTPARASLMTGKYPLSHGLFYNDKPLRTDENCIAEVYKENGYQTGYIGKWHINGHPRGMTNTQGRGLPIKADRRQGFDLWKVCETTHNYNNSIYFDENNVKHKWEGYDAIAQTKEAVKYMQANKENPFVLFVAYGPPHAPYNTAPQKYQDMYKYMDIKLRPNVPEDKAEKAKEEIRGYYAHMTALDDCIAELQKEIKNLGLEENTIFVFTSDHGDMLYSHSEIKKQKPWEESIHIPFILKYPAKLKAGSQMTKMFSFPDIMPTLLGMSNLPIPDSVEGLNYTGQLLGTQELSVDAALITCPVPFHQWKYKNGGREFRGVRTEKYTYVKDLNGPWLLYDNLNDPYQMNNVVGKEGYKTIQADLEVKLKAILDKQGDQFLPGEEYMKKWNYQWDGSDSDK
ncbi:sulfatase family protein [Siansivirga zeaxanthinifaciens]|uniref:Sulfatase n=1 Tax=Siansivirga zeaxanthinifaciens CC-SAMT-1 TaxID=1454006 RepID=A0A0C5WH88_9FLAO|nr:sulfatase [Siansivirga zeaxanthinifaciens]AJR04519.1 sulfatase [Siansivirga zeaxanthinifaciens CC-SAMT-1]